MPILLVSTSLGRSKRHLKGSRISGPRSPKKTNRSWNPGAGAWSTDSFMRTVCMMLHTFMTLLRTTSATQNSTDIWISESQMSSMADSNRSGKPMGLKSLPKFWKPLWVSQESLKQSKHLIRSGLLEIQFTKLIFWPQSSTVSAWAIRRMKS